MGGLAVTNWLARQSHLQNEGFKMAKVRFFY